MNSPLSEMVRQICELEYHSHIRRFRRLQELWRERFQALVAESGEHAHRRTQHSSAFLCLRANPETLHLSFDWRVSSRALNAGDGVERRYTSIRIVPRYVRCNGKKTGEEIYTRSKFRRHKVSESVIELIEEIEKDLNKLRRHCKMTHETVRALKNCRPIEQADFNSVMDRLDPSLRKKLMLQRLLLSKAVDAIRRE